MVIELLVVCDFAFLPFMRTHFGRLPGICIRIALWRGAEKPLEATNCVEVGMKFLLVNGDDARLTRAAELIFLHKIEEFAGLPAH